MWFIWNYTECWLYQTSKNRDNCAQMFVDRAFKSIKQKGYNEYIRELDVFSNDWWLYRTCFFFITTICLFYRKWLFPEAIIWYWAKESRDMTQLPQSEYIHIYLHIYVCFETCIRDMLKSLYVTDSYILWIAKHPSFWSQIRSLSSL